MDASLRGVSVPGLRDLLFQPEVMAAHDVVSRCEQQVKQFEERLVASAADLARLEPDRMAAFRAADGRTVRRWAPILGAVGVGVATALTFSLGSPLAAVGVAAAGVVAAVAGGRRIVEGLTSHLADRHTRQAVQFDHSQASGALRDARWALATAEAAASHRLQEDIRPVVESMLRGSVSPRDRDTIIEHLSVLPPELLRSLQTFGLTFAVETPVFLGHSVPEALGLYNQFTHEITFHPEALRGKEARHVVLHETAHCIDHMRTERQRLVGGLPILKHLASLRDALFNNAEPELRDSYYRYQARSLVQDAMELRHHVSADGMEISVDDGWGDRQVSYRRSGGQETFTITDRTASLLPRWLSQKTRVRVKMQNGHEAVVTQQGKVAEITMPVGAQAREATWSDYAHRSNKPAEYLAEGLGRFFNGPEDRLALKHEDPALYRHLSRLVEEELQRVL